MKAGQGPTPGPHQGRAFEILLSERNLRAARLTTGLILFAYVATHLLDHTLGNVSIAAMQADLAVQVWIWQGLLGTAALYGALVVHYLLGLYALYQRRHFGRTHGEIWQLALGLAIPFLLVNHVVSTRIARLQFHIVKGYPQELHAFWVARPDLGILQAIVLVVAWAHGCLGIFFWLRLKSGFPRFASTLLVAATLLPTLAVLGVVQSGRTIVGLASGGAWRAANLRVAQIGTARQVHALAGERNEALLVMGGLLVAVLIARLARSLAERRTGTVRITYPDGRSIRVPLGFTVLDASRVGRIAHVSLCGGRARCSTCQIRVVGGTGVPPVTPGELAVLHRARADPATRLACQLRPFGDISVVPLIPPQPAAYRTRASPRAGEERFIVILVADMRNSMTLAATRLPFDAVFVIDRFVSALSDAITSSGGQPNQFTGDGLLSVFGLDEPPERACRQAVEAIAAIGDAIASLNRVLAAEHAAPIRFGLGVHGGDAVVGEVTLAGVRISATLGEAANIATRLEGLCKLHGCEAVVSDLVCRTSGLPLAGLPVIDADIRGRADTLAVRLVAKAQGFSPWAKRDASLLDQA